MTISQLRLSVWSCRWMWRVSLKGPRALWQCLSFRDRPHDRDEGAVRLTVPRVSKEHFLSSITNLQVDVEALPEGPKNPYGNAFIPVETDLTTEMKAQRVCDPHKARLWKIRNPNSLHPITGAILFTSSFFAPCCSP